MADLLTRAVYFAQQELPPGWMIRVETMRGTTEVILIDPDGAEVGYGEPPDDLDAAIRVAISLAAVSEKARLDFGTSIKEACR